MLYIINIYRYLQISRVFPRNPCVSPRGYSPGMAADKCRKLTGTALQIQY